MRAAIVAALLLSGCFDLEALYNENGGTDMSDMADATDLAAVADLAMMPPDLNTPDLSPPPTYWVNSLAGVTNTKALRGIGGAGGTLFAVGDTGTCLISTDGKIWTAPTTGANTNFAAVWASAANNAWLVGSGSRQIYLYNGNTFSQGAGVPNNLAYQAIYGLAANRVLADGADLNRGTQFNSGANLWAAQNHQYNARQHGMWGMTNRLWTVGDNVSGGYYDFQINKWSAKQTIAASANTIAFRAVWGTADTDVWAVGDQGNISHYTNAAFAAVFSSGTANVPVNLNGVWGLAANDIWAVGDGGTILHYDGTGWKPWTSKQDVGTDQLLAIWGNGTNLWTVSAQGHIFRYR